MPWRVRYDPSSSIVEVVYRGTVTGEELRQAAAKRVQIQHENDTLLVLTDTSQIAYLEAGILDAHGLPENVYGQENANRRTHLALVLPKDEEALITAQHYVVACNNRGWLVRSFDQRQDATEWLLSIKRRHEQGDAKPSPPSK